LLQRATLAAALVLGSTGAQAITCYVVFDRSENVIYRDVYPPVDMSEKGATAREAMRRRGEFLMFGDFERCPTVEFVTGAAGAVNLDLQAAMSTTPLPTAATPAGAPASRPAPAPPAAPKR
jgi:hypothetical protein